MSIWVLQFLFSNRSEECACNPYSQQFFYFIFKSVNTLMGVNFKVYNFCCTFRPKFSWMRLNHATFYVCFVSQNLVMCNSIELENNWSTCKEVQQMKESMIWQINKICFQHLNMLNPGLDFQRASWARIKRVPDVQWPFFSSSASQSLWYHYIAYYMSSCFSTLCLVRVYGILQIER